MSDYDQGRASGRTRAVLWTVGLGAIFALVLFIVLGLMITTR